MTTDDGKDLMATYVKQLLALDENTRSSTLQNLSHYAENKQESSSSGEDAPKPRKVSISTSAPETHVIWPEHPLGMTMGIASKAQVQEPATPSYVRNTPATATSADDTPVKVPLPLGISAGVPGASAQLQQAHGFLQAAMKNWEACVEQEASQQAAKVNRAAAVKHPTQQASKKNVQKTNAQQASPPEVEVLSLLDKALSDLATSLPPEAAVEVQQLIAAATAADDANPVQRAKKAEMLKWLTQYLEEQQTASMQKLSHMVMGSPGDATAAWTPPLVQPTEGWGVGVDGLVMPGTRLARSRAAANAMHWLEPGQRFNPAAAGPCFLPMAKTNWWGEAGSAYQVRPGTLLQQRIAPMPGAASRTAGATWATEGKKESLETLRMHLRALLKVDSKRVLIARKINRLGFASDSVLEAHYSAYGEVERVLVAHSRVKPATRPGRTQAAGAQHSRLRPSGLGFVVMCNAESAQRILAQGSEQLVNGSVIKVQQFERRMTETGEEELNDGEEDDL
mmetsp:Transcript_44263/g.94325  ORF Transcript_44263/g.94325 Transcript_44263/m.94325 type:complete len:509 (+) Transcript_44263:177-1703(+)